MASEDQREALVAVGRGGEEPRLDGIAIERHRLARRGHGVPGRQGDGGAVQEELVEEQRVARLEQRSDRLVALVGQLRRQSRCRPSSRTRPPWCRSRARVEARGTKSSPAQSVSPPQVDRASQTLTLRMPSPRNAPSWCQSARNRALGTRRSVHLSDSDRRALAEVLGEDVGAARPARRPRSRRTAPAAPRRWRRLRS